MYPHLIYLKISLTKIHQIWSIVEFIINLLFVDRFRFIYFFFCFIVYEFELALELFAQRALNRDWNVLHIKWNSNFSNSCSVLYFTLSRFLCSHVLSYKHIHIHTIQIIHTTRTRSTQRLSHIKKINKKIKQHERKETEWTVIHIQIQCVFAPIHIYALTVYVKVYVIFMAIFSRSLLRSTVAVRFNFCVLFFFLFRFYFNFFYYYFFVVSSSDVQYVNNTWMRSD